APDRIRAAEGPAGALRRIGESTQAPAVMAQRAFRRSGERVMIDSAQLAQGLVQAGLLSEAQLRNALEFQQKTGGDLRDILPKLGHIREAVLVQFIAKEQHMHFVDPETVEIDEELMAKIPREVIERHQIGRAHV